MRNLSTWFVCLMLIVAAFLSACQKDENVVAATATPTRADSSEMLKDVSAPGNYLATKGTLKVKIQDSTYTFDASQDSIAFVNINIDGQEYYGVTAINKAHTFSFGISSQGAPIAEIPGSVSGCQFLLNSGKKTNIEYTLTPSIEPKDYGVFALDKYNQETTLAKGTFHTYLTKSLKKGTALYVVDGSFDLQVK